MYLVTNNEQKEMPDIITEMINIIDDVDQYTRNRSEMGGLDWGMECFNDAFEGLNPGMHLIAGAPNTGKSCLCLNMAWNIVKANKDTENPAYVLYMGLDDNTRELLPRIVAMDQRIPISVVSKPRKYAKIMNMQPALMRREEGIKNLKENIPYFKIIDQSYAPGINDIETIERVIKRHIAELKDINPNYKMVVFIDNFHNINSEIGYYSDDKSKFNYISGQIGEMCTLYDMPIICTAEVQKSQGAHRLITGAVREGYKIEYDAKVVMLCYNDVGMKGESANLYWEQEGYNEKRPVLEVRIGKNKISAFKRTMFFEFVPEMSYIRQATPSGSIRYAQMIGG